MPPPKTGSPSSPQNALKNQLTNDSLILLSHLCEDLEHKSDEFQKEFKFLLKDKNFLHAGGVLAFGLEYKYTYSQVDCEIKGLGGLRNFFKPVDMMFYNFCESCGLKPEVKIVYKTPEHPSVNILSDTISPFPSQIYGSIPEWRNEDGLDSLCRAIGGDAINLSSGLHVYRPGKKFGWLKPIKHINNKAGYLEKDEDGGYSVSSVSRSYALVVNIPRWSEYR